MIPDMLMEWFNNDEVHAVTVLELSICRMHGSTYKEAIKQGQEVIEGWVDAAHG